MTHADIAGLTSTDAERTFQEMLVAIGYSQSNLASSEDGDDGADEDEEESQQGKRSEHNQSSWVMTTIVKGSPLAEYM
jgi:hypothetical protein